LIGGVGMTEVHVYAHRTAPDGTFSGCPHVHAVTDEAYYVLRGTGQVEFHDLRNGLRTLPLSIGTYAHFPPMVMHRLISDGDLVVLGVMGNAGLAEQGEARIYFGAAVDSDDAQFAKLVGLPRDHGLPGALERRDAAVLGYMQLMRLWQSDRGAYFAELARFFDHHCSAMASRAGQLALHVENGPIAWAMRTLARIDQLPSRANDGPTVLVNAPQSESAFGMCGVLRPMLSLAPIRSA
jgi:mannose-6-phosphate isomerase-like protein (cupin superfamily)